MTTYQPGVTVKVTRGSIQGNLAEVTAADDTTVWVNLHIANSIFKNIPLRHDEVEHYDTTEGIDPTPVGYQEPAEQTGSDDEVSALSWETYPPRPRIWADRKENESGFITWHLRLPDGSSYAYDSHAEAAEALRVFSMTNGAVAA